MKGNWQIFLLCICALPHLNPPLSFLLINNMIDILVSFNIFYHLILSFLSTDMVFRTHLWSPVTALAVAGSLTSKPRVASPVSTRMTTTTIGPSSRKTSPKPATTDSRSSRSVWTTSLKNMRMMKRRNDRQQRIRREWALFATVIDRLLFCIYACFTISMSVVVLRITPAQQESGL